MSKQETKDSSCQMYRTLDLDFASICILKGLECDKNVYESNLCVFYFRDKDECCALHERYVSQDLRLNSFALFAVRNKLKMIISKEKQLQEKTNRRKQ